MTHNGTKPPVEGVKQSQLTDSTQKMSSPVEAEAHTVVALATDVVAALAERDERNAKVKDRLSDSGRADWPPVYADPFPELYASVPEIDIADLTAEIMGGAVAHHGLLLVRGLFSADQVADVPVTVMTSHAEINATHVSYTLATHQIWPALNPLIIRH